jgi:hypothetical protein
MRLFTKYVCSIIIIRIVKRHYAFAKIGNYLNNIGNGIASPKEPTISEIKPTTQKESSTS